MRWWANSFHRTKQNKPQHKSNMDIRDHKFPKLTGLDLAFPTVPTDKNLLAEAHQRGFTSGDTPYERLFSDLFYKGGSLDFKSDLPEPFKKDATMYLKALMGSWEPKHEHKQSVCALLLSELVNLPTEKATA